MPGILPCGMAMPIPTPVVPRRSRSLNTSKMRRSGWPVTAAALRASSCRACFLPVTLKFATTRSGGIISGIALGHPGASGQRPRERVSVPLRSLPFRVGIDPADMAVLARVEDMGPAIARIAEDQGRLVGEVEPHDR